jgi:hypothetical protein
VREREMSVGEKRVGEIDEKYWRSVRRIEKRERVVIEKYGVVE